MTGDHRRALGRAGENTAARILEEAGLVVRERNWRAGRSGELDLIAEDGARIVVVEVRTRIGDHRGTALESVDARKIVRLRGLAARWAREHECRRPVGVDIIALALDPADRDAILAAGPEADLREFGARANWVRGVA